MAGDTPARKIAIDIDPCIDGAVALALALFDPSLEVLAVTAVAGNVSAEQATRNVQALISNSIRRAGRASERPSNRIRPRPKR